jgi:biopolymer transport protein ExbD
MGIRRGSNHKNAEGIFEPNMTPLIDVSLVLVVILLVATPLAFQSGISVRMASKSGQAAHTKARTERVEIAVRADGGLEINRRPVAREQLGAVLGPMLEHSETRLVVIRGEGTVPHGTIVNVMDEARALGASHLALVGN